MHASTSLPPRAPSDAGGERTHGVEGEDVAQSPTIASQTGISHRPRRRDGMGVGGGENEDGDEDEVPLPPLYNRPGKLIVPETSPFS